MVASWLATDFGGGESARKIEKISGIERKYGPGEKTILPVRRVAAAES